MHVLIVGDLAGLLTRAMDLFLKNGGQMTQVASRSEAIDLIRSGNTANITLIDVHQDIPAFAKELHQEHLRTTIVACSVGDVAEEKINEAIQAGAQEYIPLPPDEELIAEIFDVFLQSDGQVVFQDPKIKEVLNFVERVAPSDANVLITGESGTGKEVMARYIHSCSKRKNKRFLSVNCAAIPDNLLESELFGHEKGSFTGALARRIGKFEEASGGTLLLDEITEMHPRLQAKLLRALQEKEIDRVGGSTPIKVDFRLLATSNRDLGQAIQEGTFREDLYFRLNVLRVHLPSLRERPLDIQVLAQHFTIKYANVNGLSPAHLPAETLQCLKSYTWPGNVRELENVIHRGVLLAEEGEILPKHLGLQEFSNSPSTEASDAEAVNCLVGKTVEDVEKGLILSTFKRCDRDAMRASQLLGISLKTLEKKLASYKDKPQSGVV
jgi:DNA-binding NtrC family response regulator